MLPDGTKSKRNLLVFLIPLIVCISSLSVFAVFLRLRWMDDDRKRTGGYCEISNGKLFVEPINTMSNFSFIIIGLIIAWQMMIGTFKENSNNLTRSDFMSIFFSSLIICLGPASMAMHAFYTSWGTTLDVLSMFLVCAFLVGYSIQRFFKLNVIYFICIYVVVIIICEWVSRWQIKLPIIEYATNLIFACFIILAVIFECLIVFVRRTGLEKKWGIASIVTLLIAFLIWNFSKTGDRFCYPESFIQGHALWHSLDALSIYFLFRYYVSERDCDNQYHLMEQTHSDVDEEMIVS